MERDERRRAQALDDYWDAVQRGEQKTRPLHVDEFAASVIARLAARRAPNHTDAVQWAVRLRILEPTRHTNGRADSFRYAMPDDLEIKSEHGGWRTGFRWFPAVLIIAILIAVGVEMLSRLDEDVPRAVPAVVAPTGTAVPTEAVPTVPSTEGVASDDLVLEATIPADALPTEEAFSSFTHYTLPPSTSSTWTSPTAVKLVYVFSGFLTIQVDDGSAFVWRPNNSDWVAEANGTAVDLESGDAILVLGMTSADFDNSRSTPVEMLQWDVTEYAGGETVVPSAWLTNDYHRSGDQITLTGDPVRLRLRRIVLEPGGLVYAPAGAYVQLGVTLPWNESGTPVAHYVTRLDTHVIGNTGDKPVTVYVVVAEPDVPR